MEVLGFISAIIGLITALINRNTILQQRYGRGNASSAYTSGQPITVKKRFKRFLLAMAIAMVFPCLSGAAGAGSEADEFFIWPFAICLLIAAYQFLAMLILIFAKLWR